MDVKKRTYIIGGILVVLLLVYLIDRAVIDYALDPLLKMPSVYAILIIAFIITLVMTLIYKYVTDQAHMKKLKADMKKYQDEMKKSATNKDKMMSIQKSAMDVNMQMMRESFKPMFLTFIPIILIFGWLNTNLTYMPVHPGQEFVLRADLNANSGLASIKVPDSGVTLLDAKDKEIAFGNVSWRLKGDAGIYLFELSVNNRTYEHMVQISDYKYMQPIMSYPEGPLKGTVIEMQKTHPFGSFSLFGWFPGWLGVYILFSLPLSILLRKILDVA